MTIIEFYDGDGAHPFASVQSDAVPRLGEFVNIRKVTWLVTMVTWAVDQPVGDPAKLRANVVLERPKT